MGMAQQRESSRPLALPQPVAQLGDRGSVVGIPLQQAVQLVVFCWQVLLQQSELAGEQKAIRVAWLTRFALQLRQQQSAIVVARAFSSSSSSSTSPGPNRFRQWPAAGGVKEIALVDDVSVDAALGGFGPPAQGQADGFASVALAPSLRPVQRMAQAQVLAALGQITNPRASQSGRLR